MAKNKTVATATPVEDFIDGVSDRQKRQDCLDMIAMMRNVTGHEPRMWGSMPGFERYEALTKKLGPHRTGKSCLYVKNLEVTDRDILKEIIRDSVARMRENHPSS